MNELCYKDLFQRKSSVKYSTIFNLKKIFKIVVFWISGKGLWNTLLWLGVLFFIKFVDRNYDFTYYHSGNTLNKN